MTNTPVVSDEVVASIESVSLSVNGFNPNEMMAIEEHFDLDFQDVAKAMIGEVKINGGDGKPIRTGRLLQTLSWLKLNQDYPGITFEQAGSVPLALKGEDGEPDGSDGWPSWSTSTEVG